MTTTYKKCLWQRLPDIPVKILEDVYFNPSSSGFFYPKQNVALREKIDTVLEEMQAEGSLKNYLKHFSMRMCR